MSKEEFKKQITKIQTAYNKKFTQEEAILWFEQFKKMTANEFEKAVNKTIQELSFIPKIADVMARIEANPMNDNYAYLYKNLEWCQMVKE